MTSATSIAVGAGAVALVVGAVLKTCFNDMLNDEFKARVDDLPAALVRIALRLLPAEMRDYYRADWEGNLLAAFNDETSRYPVTRFFRSFGFGFSLMVGARRISKETALARDVPLISSATPEQAFEIGMSAYHGARLRDAEVALDRACSSSNPTIAATALFNRGVALYELGRHDEALGAFERTIDTYRAEPQPDLREPVARSLRNRGIGLWELGRHDEALDNYQQFIDTYRDDPAQRVHVAVAEFSRATILGVLRRRDEAAVAHQQFIDTYRDDPALQEYIAIALRGRALLRQLGHG